MKKHQFKPLSMYVFILMSLMSTALYAKESSEKSMSTNQAQQAVIDTVNLYMAGLKDPKTAKQHLEAAFYSSTNLHSLDEQGNLQFMPRDALVRYAASGEVPSVKGDILTVDITQDMAFVKVHLDLPDRDFYDYLTLLKLNVGWKIVSKTFTTVMK